MSSLYGTRFNTASNACHIHDTKSRKAPRKAGAPALITDENVKAMRALFDYRGWSKKELAAYFKVNYSSVARVIDGLTKAKIPHSEADVPKGL